MVKRMGLKERKLFLFREYSNGELKLCSVVNGDLYSREALDLLIQDAKKKGMLTHASHGTFWVLTEYIFKDGFTAWSLFRFTGLPKLPLNDNFHLYNWTYNKIREILRMVGVES